MSFLEEALESLILDEAGLLFLDDSSLLLLDDSSSLLLLHSSVRLVFTTLLLRRTKPRLQPRDTRDQCIRKRGKRMTGRRLRSVQIGEKAQRVFRHCKYCAKSVQKREEKKSKIQVFLCRVAMPMI